MVFGLRFSFWTDVFCCAFFSIADRLLSSYLFFFFQAEDGIRDLTVTGVQTCALPIWFGVALRFGQNFFQRRGIFQKYLRISSCWRTKLYGTRAAEGGDDRSLECRHVITLDPKLIDVVWNVKRERFILGLNQLNGRKPAFKTIRADLRLERGRQPLPQLRTFLIHSRLVNSVTQMPHSPVPREIAGKARRNIELLRCVIPR